MNFGHVSEVDSICFDLPPDDPRNRSRVHPFLPQDQEHSTRSVRVYFGAPVWTCKQWVGTIYPKGTKANDYLKWYGQQFNAIELNASFYRVPTPEQIQRWLEQVPLDFRFAPKLHQSISHFQGASASTREALTRFWKNIEKFGDRLGVCFLQLPPHFGFQHWENFQQFLKIVPEPCRLAVEMRHSSWFTHNTLRQEVFEFFQNQGISAVITDVAGRRDILHSSRTGSQVFIRFLGNELHPSDYRRIDDWVLRLSDWINQGVEEIYFFIHQPTETEVPELARVFVDSLNQKCRLSIRTCQFLSDKKATSESQLMLF